MALPMPLLGRRKLLKAVSLGGACVAASAVEARLGFAAPAPNQVEENELIAQLMGGSPEASPRVRLDMPATFMNGHSVRLKLAIDSPMDDTDFVRQVYVLAPRNPIPVVARFQFTPQSGRAAISTRVRLAESQNVLAAAEMRDGSVLVGRTFVEIAVNGCPTT
jgi:sulfur-oxidizing protein SoxY